MAALRVRRTRTTAWTWNGAQLAGAAAFASLQPRAALQGLGQVRMRLFASLQMSYIRFVGSYWSD
jgi:hypothetical protein